MAGRWHRRKAFASPPFKQKAAYRWDMVIVGLFLFLLAINAWTILMFWSDKRQAIAGDRRIPEADLLMLAFIGGSPGAFLARHIFRHKTRKEPFSTYLMLVAVVQLGALIGWCVI